MTGFGALLIGIYLVAAGFGILGWWALEWAGHGKGALFTHGASHIAAELVAFFTLVTGGVLLLAGGPYTAVVVPAALGMLLYATINALGRVGRESARLGTIMVVEALVTVVIILALGLGF